LHLALRDELLEFDDELLLEFDDELLLLFDDELLLLFDDELPAATAVGPPTAPMDRASAPARP
jgi:hypothetical protein